MLRTAVLSLALLPMFTGCVAVSMHSTRPVEVRVTQEGTDFPVSDAPVEIRYSHDSYGVFYVLRKPKPASAETDERGIAMLPMADFFQSVVLNVNGERFRLNKQLVRHGGVLRLGRVRAPSKEPLVCLAPPYVVQLTPKK